MFKKMGMSWQRLIMGVLFIVMLVIPWSGTAMAQIDGNTQTGTNSTTGAIPGTHVVHYSSKKVLADGGITYTFDVNGAQNLVVLAPDGFSPTTATDAQLAEYGFPARPSDKDALAAWTTKWSRFKYKRSSTDPTIVITPFQAIQATNTSSAWSGYMDLGSGNEFNNIGANYTQPTWQSDSVSGSAESSWVGLGGWGVNQLIQCGTSIGINPNTGNLESGAYGAWYEFLPSDAYMTFYTPFKINGGDDIDSQLYYTSSSNYPVGFTVWDFTAGNYFSVDLPASQGASCYNGSTAEFIDERPTSNGQPLPLADYKQNPWVDCYVNNNQSPFSSFALDNIIMYNSSDNQELSYPNYPAQSPYNLFTDTFYHSS